MGSLFFNRNEAIGALGLESQGSRCRGQERSHTNDTEKMSETSEQATLWAGALTSLKFLAELVSQPPTQSPCGKYCEGERVTLDLGQNGLCARLARRNHVDISHHHTFRVSLSVHPRALPTSADTRGEEATGKRMKL
jgi:hypothetical protein